VSFSRVLLVFLLGGAVALGGEYALRHRQEPPPPTGGIATIRGNVPNSPSDPPVVWLEGTVEDLDPSSLTLREGQGPRIRIRRFEEGATDFLRVEEGAWRELADQEVEILGVGGQACVEALLDGRTLFALRVFLGARCGPA
jgi:hypothetical protein